MSDSTALSIILAAMIASTYVGIWTGDKLAKRAIEIVTGVASGVRLSTSDRWMIVYNIVVPACIALWALSIIDALAMYYIADAVGESRVRYLAYATAVLSGAAALQWLAGIPVALFYFKSVLNESGKTEKQSAR